MNEKRLKGSQATRRSPNLSDTNNQRPTKQHGSSLWFIVRTHGQTPLKQYHFTASHAFRLVAAVISISALAAAKMTCFHASAVTGRHLSRQWLADLAANTLEQLLVVIIKPTTDER